MPKKEYKLKKSEFAKESEANSNTALATVSPEMAALFSAPSQEGEASVLDTLERRNMPQMVKPVDAKGVNIPIGGVVSGVIVDVVPSPVSTIKGSLLWLHLVKLDSGKPVKTGHEITFPASGTIRNALAPGVDGEEKSKEAMLKFKGHLFVAKRMPDKLNKQYNKEMFMWDVYTSPKPVDIGVKIH